MNNKKWFENWFDTPYYHMLYQNRNDKEANAFISKLVDYLSISPGSRILDAACGKGRHSYFLNKLGMSVLGFDLSKNSISQAQKFANSTLHFKVHDILQPIAINEFDLVLNLFTSFGYFEDFEDDFKAFSNLIQALKPKGKFVFDFFNAQKIINDLDTIPKEIVYNNIKFVTQKNIVDGFVIKKIEVEDADNDHTQVFYEKVRLIQKPELQLMLDQLNTQSLYTFGDYNLNPFDIDSSPRLILINEKLA